MPFGAREASSAAPAVVLSEVMVYPNGPGRAREYVELYNRGTLPADLTGWTLGDSLDMDALVAVSAGLLLRPGRFALVLDPDYFTAGEPYAGIPSDALIVTIEDKTFGRYGLTNDAAKTIRLRSPDGVLQSMRYTPDDVEKGRSLEKLDLQGDDSPANWGRSLAADGTPGGPNSRRVLDSDVTLVSVAAAPDTVHPPARVLIRSLVRNAGRNPVADGELVLFADLDGDSAFSRADAPIARTAFPPLARGEQAEVTVFWNADGPPVAPFRAAAVVPSDEYPQDNVLPLSVVVGIPPGSVRISELMPLPAPGEGQWVEIANVGASRVSLAGCALVAGRSAATVGSPVPVLAPGDFLVFAEYPDSLRLRYGFMVPIGALDGAFPHLSSSADAQRSVRLDDATGRTVDRAAYPVPEFGRSLERRSFDEDADDPAAWRTVWGSLNATPGLANQSMRPPAESSHLAVEPATPTDTVGIVIELPEEPVFLTIRIYDMLGREVRRLVDGARWSARGRFGWDGFDERGKPVATGMYVLLVEATATGSGKGYRLVRSVVIARRR